MNNVFKWLFHDWYVKQLKEIQDLPYKMKIETEGLKSTCLLEIQNKIEPMWLSIKEKEYKLCIKTVQNNRSRIHRDDFGKQSVHHNPVFSENQIAVLRSKFWRYRIVIVVFCIAESFLYTLTAALFVPSGGIYMQVPVAIFLALVIMFGLDYGFGTHYKYLEALERHSKKELSDPGSQKYQHLRIKGYILIAIAALSVLFAGFSRVFFLENIQVQNLPPEKALSIIWSSRMASVFTILITIGAALYMAMIKREQATIGIRYRVYRSWHNALVRRNRYTQSLIRNAHKLQEATNKCIQKYWQLVNDLKRAYKILTEYDEKYETLNEDYLKLKARPGFALNGDLYGKFAPIQCAHEELFEYGIRNAREIKDKQDFVVEVLKIPKEHLAEHLSGMPRHDEENKPTIILPSSNGKAKKHEFLIN